MNRREKLIGQALGPDINDAKVKMLDTTVRIILGDMGEHYYKMWEVEGPGVMVFQPKNKERSMFFWTLKEIHAAQESCESSNDGDMAETFRRILTAAQKIDPMEKAGYVIADDEGIRYFEIDYNQATNQ
ncbi:MAG: hypothetical protein EHM17_12920 [Verrucomicrobiaceae bacterium]|nr:MAG: hypothetical protein EHM17_12920 [Verrucomicrobiaceae bacterium]